MDTIEMFFRRHISIAWSVFCCLLVLGSCHSLDPDEAGEAINEEEILDRMVIVPDIQYYTNEEGRFKYLASIVDFLSESKVTVSTCLQVGDITYQNTADQWENAYTRFFSRIPDHIASVYCLGNHDYGASGRSGRRVSGIPDYMDPVKDISSDQFAYENYVRFIHFAGKDYAVLVLEFAPRDIALQWADTVIKDNPTTPFIILTHSFLNNDGELFDSQDAKVDDTYSPKSYKMDGEYINDSMEVFNKIAYENPNVKLFVCGHCVPKKYIVHQELKNKAGSKVHCIMVNYQHYREGGRGFVGLLDSWNGKWVLRSYSTYDSSFGKIQIQMEWE